ncbi:MAG TPA: peptidylprolyl isomerase [Verrucomicrobiae bacterium]|nr:peptidylprolyl isomerase [Verrucomicrobiae bacterium]
MRQAKQGDRVRVHYTGRLPDGEVFDSSECADDACGCEPSGPLEFTIGRSEVIPGFESGVVGMAPGDSKRVVIPVQEAYGEHNQDLVAVVPRSDLPPDMDPQIGHQLEVTQQDGSSFPVFVTATSEQDVTLDANHPLAGRELTFDIRLVEIL